MRSTFTFPGLAALAVLGGASPASAQQAQLGPCARPDSIAFEGNTRVSSEILLQDVAIARGQTLSGARALDRAIEALYSSGYYDDVTADCILPAAAGGRTVLVFRVVERPILGSVRVEGVERVSRNAVRDRIDMPIGRPLDPSRVRRAIAKIDSVYRDAGYYLARVTVDSAERAGELDLTFRVNEGRRLAISGIEILGNSALSQKEIVAGMETKREGFFWWQKGEFDDDVFAADIVEMIPRLYGERGFIDMQVVEDEIVIDEERGKALLRITVDEGPRYRVGSFEISGNRVFPVDALARHYPFNEEGRGIGEMVRGIFGATREPGVVFNQTAWEDATFQVRDAYDNEGYLYKRVEPVLERDFSGPDSIPTVHLRWDIVEGSPAIINRIDIVGNDFTSESCIRDQLFLLPGDVFNKDRFIRSYQNIANLGFFETPMDEPRTSEADPDNRRGDINIQFRVKEKKTGALNFGATVGQGTGVGGFIGFEQPNMFGRCKRGSLQWQFGQYINDFSLSYSDPRIRGSRVSGHLTAYNSRSQFVIQDIGRTTRTGAQTRIGFPLPNSRSTRLFLDYGGERVMYGDEGLVSTISCRTCFRSTLGASLEHDTRLGMPFPISGVRQAVAAQFNGGPLGGSSSFSRYTAEMRMSSTLARLPASGFSQEPVFLTFSLSSRVGALFGDPGPFFVSQAFSLGGTQYGEPLRGYEEFSITPNGFVADASQFQAQRLSFGNAFYASTAEIGLRVSQQLYFSWFYDAGNLWARPRDIDPTRLFRGSGFGALVVTPLGPLGVDLGYGFDRLDTFGRKAPKWQVHFKFGQIF